MLEELIKQCEFSHLCGGGEGVCSNSDGGRPWVVMVMLVVKLMRVVLPLLLLRGCNQLQPWTLWNSIVTVSGRISEIPRIG